MAILLLRIHHIPVSTSCLPTLVCLNSAYPSFQSGGLGGLMSLVGDTWQLNFSRDSLFAILDVDVGIWCRRATSKPSLTPQHRLSMLNGSSSTNKTVPNFISDCSPGCALSAASKVYGSCCTSGSSFQIRSTPDEGSFKGNGSSQTHILDEESGKEWHRCWNLAAGWGQA